METVAIELLVKIVMVRRLEIPGVLFKIYWPDAWLSANGDRTTGYIEGTGNTCIDAIKGIDGHETRLRRWRQGSAGGWGSRVSGGRYASTGVIRTGGRGR
jgi:hypothetical protein